MCSSKPSMPSTPPPPPPPKNPKEISAASKEAKQAQADKAAANYGASATISTSPLGLNEAANIKKNKLG